MATSTQKGKDREMDIKQIMAPPAGQEYTVLFKGVDTETEDLEQYRMNVDVFAVVELDGETKILPCITDGDGPELVPLTAEKVKQIEERSHCCYVALITETTPFDDIAEAAGRLETCIYRDPDYVRQLRCYVRTESQWN